MRPVGLSINLDGFFVESAVSFPIIKIGVERDSSLKGRALSHGSKNPVVQVRCRFDSYLSHLGRVVELADTGDLKSPDH